MKCYFCPRQATDSLKGVYDVCAYCKEAFDNGFDTGRVYESQRRRLNPRKVQKGARQ